MSIDVTPIPAFTDNYIWLLKQPGSPKVVVVDPGEAGPVLQVLQQQSLELSAILLTHHHMDHIGGVPELVAQFPVPVHGPKNDGINKLSTQLIEDDTVTLPELNVSFKVFDIPGHTHGHIAFYNDAMLFCGDTLFAGGCGRLFEGTAEQMHDSLTKLKNLPTSTKVYCAHEYTQSNLKFAEAVEPQNVDLQLRIQQTNTTRAAHQPTLPSTIELELKTNPFLRTHAPAVRQAAEQHAGHPLNDEVEVFAELRSWKDNF